MTTTDQIRGMFLHCAACIAHHQQTGRRREKLAVIGSGDHIQLWCEGCNTSVALFRLASPLPDIRCQNPGCTEHHR